MASRDLTHADSAGLEGEDNTCPLCGGPITIALEPTDFGSEWVGECVTCNAIVEVL